MSGRGRDPRDALRLPAAIGGDLPGAVPPDLGPVRRVADVWRDAVGEALARVARPARMAAERTLIVHAADASWVHAITLERRTILKRLTAALGEEAAPRDLRVEIGPVDTPPDEPAEPPPPLDPVALEAARARVADTPDPRLREALARALARVPRGD